MESINTKDESNGRLSAIQELIFGRGPRVALAILTSLFLIVGVGVGGTLAATGLIANPFTAGSQNTSLSEDQNTSSGGEIPNFKDLPPNDTVYVEGEGWVRKDVSWADSSGWQPYAAPNTVEFRFSTSSFYSVWSGPCPAGDVTVSIGPMQWGYLSDPVAGIQGIGGGTSSVINCNFFDSGSADSLQPMMTFVGPWKCYNFNEVWVEISGPTPAAGLHKISIPDNISKYNCPAGSESNDPNYFLFSHMREQIASNYPDAIVTPPGFGKPPSVDLGPFRPEVTPTPATSEEALPTPTATPTDVTEPTPIP
jgi:hypothetical protein